MITVVDPWHWLTETGALPAEPRLRARMLRVAACIEAGGPMPRGHARETLVPCRRRPGGEACPGLLWVVKQDDDALHALCLVCRADEFMIHNWEDTDWAEGPMDPVDVAEVFGPKRDAPPPAGVVASVQRDGGNPLADLLARMKSRLTADAVREQVPTAGSPVEIIETILASVSTPPPPALVEELLPILYELWNATPRPELGGRSPARAHVDREPARAAAKIGRNAPCPCGSGKKYKRCCGANGGDDA